MRTSSASSPPCAARSGHATDERIGGVLPGRFRHLALGDRHCALGAPRFSFGSPELLYEGSACGRGASPRSPRSTTARVGSRWCCSAAMLAHDPLKYHPLEKHPDAGDRPRRSRPFSRSVRTSAADCRVRAAGSLNRPKRRLSSRAHISMLCDKVVRRHIRPAALDERDEDAG